MSTLDQDAMSQPRGWVLSAGGMAALGATKFGAWGTHVSSWISLVKSLVLRYIPFKNDFTKFPAGNVEVLHAANR